jgi:serine/threonine protein kinase
VKSDDGIAPNLEDSQEAKAMVGKNDDELKFRKLIKEKLKVTKIPKLQLKENSGLAGEKIYNFSEFYKFNNFLGAGSFGFVVAAEDLESGEMMAVKIVDVQSQSSIHSLKKEAEILQSLRPNPNVI